MSATNTYQNDARATAPGGTTQVPGMRTTGNDGTMSSDYRHDDTRYDDRAVDHRESGEKKTKKTMAFAGLALMDFLLISVRFWQFVFSVIVLGLLAYVLKGYSFHGSTKTNYGLAVAAISVFYLLLLCVLAPVLHVFLMPGLYLLMELIMMILWLVAFVVLAKSHGSTSCGLKQSSSYNSQYGSFQSFQSSGGSYDPYTNRYTSNANTRPCHSSQAAIAFSGITLILFMLTPILIGLLVIKPLVNRGGTKAAWAPYKNVGLKLNPWTGLRVSSAEGNDAEALANHASGQGGVGQDQHTFSTGDSTYNGAHHDKMAETDHRRNVSGTTDMDPNMNNPAYSANPTHTTTTHNTAPATQSTTGPKVTSNTTYSRNEPIITDPSPNPVTESRRPMGTDTRV
ncbi:LANO_0H04060g1_1 [Lachancea nothofagi CBS 11611]|uniref:LANO_0H04060g1_1 n=1 Tax=Lachancea nothofagi CBS 11611 TaxID=1266666 RepID=A0A1G4KLC0_9SACH|nr:LANO_0H04060g1_1 [Lachancea nothofagi CBS 11611]